jgi:hypothetical protein
MRELRKRHYSFITATAISSAQQADSGVSPTTDSMWQRYTDTQFGVTPGVMLTTELPTTTAAPRGYLDVWEKLAAAVPSSRPRWAVYLYIAALEVNVLKCRWEHDEISPDLWRD